MNRNLFITSLIALLSLGAFADKPKYTAECSPESAAGKPVTLHFDLKEDSVFEPKEKEPIWLDYNEDLGQFTVCQQKSQYVSEFLNSLIGIMKKPNFRKESLSIGKMKIDPLSAPFVCVRFSKKGYEYVGAFIFSHLPNRFPSPNDNRYSMLFLPLEGKAKDALLGKPTIPTSVGSQKSLLAKTRSYDCRSLGGEAPEEFSPPMESIEPSELAE
jgi:hypothetical protein